MIIYRILWIRKFRLCKHWRSGIIREENNNKKTFSQNRNGKWWKEDKEFKINRLKYGWSIWNNATNWVYHSVWINASFALFIAVPNSINSLHNNVISILNTFTFLKRFRFYFFMLSMVQMIRCFVFNRFNRSFDASHYQFQFSLFWIQNRFTSYIIIIGILSQHTSIVAANYKLNEIEWASNIR